MSYNIDMYLRRMMEFTLWNWVPAFDLDDMWDFEQPHIRIITRERMSSIWSERVVLDRYDFCETQLASRGSAMIPRTPADPRVAIIANEAMRTAEAERLRQEESAAHEECNDRLFRLMEEFPHNWNAA